MKKIVFLVLSLVALFTLFSFTVLAAPKNINYYDENGNSITINGLYYNSEGYPMYNANCFYLDQDDNPVYVGGCRAYYYNENGELSAGNYYYDSNGNAISVPASYPGGWGCGAWYYNDQGNVVNSTTYYDDFGNPIEVPAQLPAYGRGGGGCCARRW